MNGDSDIFMFSDSSVLLREVEVNSKTWWFLYVYKKPVMMDKI